MSSKSISTRIKRSLALAAVGAMAFHLITRENKYFSLRGKVALVTGGSRGLGFLIARELLQRGCRVAICARSNNELQRAEDDLRHFGSQIFTIQCDLINERDCNRVVEEVQSRFGKIDILVNNAGVIVSGPYSTMEDSDYAELLKIHFWAPYYLTKAVLPEMQKNRGGRIVNISSIGGRIAVPHFLPYSASKFALRGFSKGLEAELAKDNIVVTTVYPGLMRTGSQINAYFKGNYRAEYALFKAISAIPGVSIAADGAARRIVRAIEYGESEIVIGVLAKIMDFMHALMPSLVGGAAALISRMLPYGENHERLRGREIPLSKVAKLISGPVDKAASAFHEK